MKLILIVLFVGLLVGLFVGYYLFILIDTSNIMQQIKKIEKDVVSINEFEQGNPLRPFANDIEENTYVRHIRRYFTWCWNGKGRIWLYTVVEVELEDEVIKCRDDCSIVIEKKNGEWEVIQYENSP